MTLTTPPEVLDIWEHNEHQHFGPKWDGWGERVASMVGISAFDRVVLDWGCGGCAVLRAMQGRCRAYFAVDVSPRARQAASDLGAVVMDPGEASRRPRPYADVVLSVATFQHFHSKQYARDVLGVLRRALKPGGYGLVQIRVAEVPKEDLRPYSERYIDGLEWTVPEFWRDMKGAGLTPQYMRLEDEYGWFTFGG